MINRECLAKLYNGSMYATEPMLAIRNITRKYNEHANECIEKYGFEDINTLCDLQLEMESISNQERFLDGFYFGIACALHGTLDFNSNILRSAQSIMETKPKR